MKTLAAALIALFVVAGDVSAQAVDSSRYAAVAFSKKTGKYGYGYDHPSRFSAERAALRNCPEADAKVLTWTRFGYIVLLIAADGSPGFGQVNGAGANSRDAYEEALANLRKNTKSPIKTYVRVCSGDVAPVVKTFAE